MSLHFTMAHIQLMFYLYSWEPSFKKNVSFLGRMPKIFTKMIPSLWNTSHGKTGEAAVISFEERMMRGDLTEVFIP